MRIKSLTVHGFKSFADRTKFDLHDGITAIIGPNGCGKSNISDAIRWVLGEQRPTAIRGSRMEEAIFGGTEQRRPIHRAEVALELSNEDGTLPLPYAEVQVGRTVYRGGESEYALNGAPCRLRDIQDLCRDTGLGANAYSVIESRMIDAILSDRAEERRSLFEEAAEIGRYKDRRRIALRRLEQAEADLQRLEDVLVEIQSKVRSLAQQRGRAERHTRLRERLLRLEVGVADAKLARTEARLREAEVEMSGLARTRPSEEADLQTAETEAETLRIQGAELERERSTLARQVEELRQALESRERERILSEERARAAETRLETLTDDLEDLAARREALSSQMAQAEADAAEAATRHATRIEEEAPIRAEFEALAEAEGAAREGLESARASLEGAVRELAQFDAEYQTAAERARERGEEIEERRPALAELDQQEAELKKSIEAIERRETEVARAVKTLDRAHEKASAALSESEREVADARARVARLDGQLSGARARTSTLKNLLDSAAHLPNVVSELLDAEVDGVRGVLSEYVDAPAEWAERVEALLGRHLHGVVVDDWASVERVRAWLAARETAEALLILPLDPGPRSGRRPRGELLERVEAMGPGAPWVEALLAGVGVHGDERLEPADRPWVGLAGRQDEWGAVHLGRTAGAEGILAQRAELGREEARVERLAAELVEARAAAESREAAHARARTEAERIDSERRRAHLALRDLAAELRAGESRASRIARERFSLSGRIEQLEAFRSSAIQLTQSGEAEREALETAVSEAERKLTDAREAAYEARQAADTRRGALHDLQLELARAEAELKSHRDTVERLDQTGRDLEGRAAAVEADRTRQAELRDASLALSAAAEEEIGGRVEERARLERQLAALEARIAESRASLETRESALREARRAEREHAERRHALELELTRLRAARASVHERLEVEWDATLDELRVRTEPLDAGDPEAWETELDSVRRSLARIGPVNLLAQQEYEEEQERLEFLLSQRDDLVSARNDLRESIRRINRDASEAFTSTFAEIRKNFQDTFQALFQGGECDVWLEDPEDALDSPIEISASPRGKRTQRIHLLSGGERALTALSLLFGIYLTKPSPFCLMDEVDAPLDETNVLRFVKLLQDFKSDTQFLVITHNPRTIEGADWVYGVTMQEPGVSSIVGVTFDETSSQVA